MAFEIRLLGPVEALSDSTAVPLQGTKQRAVLAMLALHPNEVVSLERLIEGLWGEDPPPSASKMIQLHVSRLRKLLPREEAQIVTRTGGYELRIDPDAVDAGRLERLVARVGGGGDGRADGNLAAGLPVWRGDALADVRDQPFAESEIRRLDELRLAAMELEIEADVHEGRHRVALVRLDRLLAEYPLRERLHALKMLALYRGGRQGEALEAFQEARHVLVEELGLEPGPDLRELHQAILRQDPALGAPAGDEESLRRRLMADAGRVAEERERLRAHEAQVVDDVVELQSIREPSSRRGSRAVCPFKGLAPYEAADADFYFGREPLVAAIVARCVGAGLVGVVGASGSGKSSALRAGLLPALAADALPGSAAWPQILLRPGEKPSEELRRALADRESGEALAETAEGARLVVAIDQFEEVFTAPERRDRAAFLDEVVRLGADPARRALVLVVIRADFYGSCGAEPRLAAMLADNHVLVGPPTDEELRRAIEAPAARAGLTVEEGVVEALVRDVRGEPGALPLLSTALLELWRLREDDVLLLAAYERTGGVRGAVARLAEDAYDSLAPFDRVLARRILLRLVGFAGDPEDGGDLVVRRRIGLDELDADRDAAVARVLDVLADRRLVTVDEGAVEVAHEALLREWPRLRGWLEEDVSGRRVHRHLTAAARDWAARGRDRADLYRGSRLVAAFDWRAAHEPDLNALEREFLSQSVTASQDDAASARRANRRLRALLVAGAALLCATVAASVVAIRESSHASRAALIADAQRLGSEALLEDDLDRSLLLARAAVGFVDMPSTRGYLLAALLRSPAAVGVVRGDGDRLLSLAVSPDAGMLVSGDNDGTLVFSDVDTRRRLGDPLQAPGAIHALAFTPDGRTLAVAGSSEKSGFLWLVDVRTRNPRAELPGMGTTPVGGLAISPDGRRLAAPPWPEPDHASAGIRVWDLRRPLDQPRRIRTGGVVSPHIGFLDSGRSLVATVERRGTAVFDVDSGRARRVLANAEGFTVAVSPDGRRLAAGHEDGSVDVFDLAAGAGRRFSGRHDARIQTISWTPDGRTLVTGGDDDRVLVWDVGARALQDSWDGHAGRVLASAVSRDGGTVFTASLDGSVIMWDIRGDRRLGRPFRTGPGHPESESGAVAPDGRHLAVAHDGGVIHLLDTRSLRVAARLRLPGGRTAAKLAYAPDGVLAASGRDGLVALFAPGAGRLLGTLDGIQGAVMTPGVGRSVIVTGGEDDTVRVWDRRTRRLAGRPVLFPGGISDVSLSPDERWFAVGRNDGRAEVWNVAQRRRVAWVRTGKSAVNWARFSPDGRLLVTGDIDGTTRLWSTESWRPLGRPLQGHAGPIISAPVSGDGRRLATSSTDGTIRLYNLASGVLLGVLPGVPNVPVAAAFTPDGTHLFASHVDGRAYRWDVRTTTWVRQACLVASREPTRAEWAEVAAGRPYRRICG